MRRNSSLLLIALLVLVTLITALAAAAEQKRKMQPNYEEVGSDEWASQGIPHPDDNDETAEELSCNACAASVQLMRHELEKLKKEFHLQPEKLKEYHALAAIDGLCKKYSLEMGLLAKSKNHVTKEFVHQDTQKGKAEAVLKGGWITKFWTQKCEDMVTEAEDNIGAMMKGKNIKLCPACVEMEKKFQAKKKKEEAKARRRKMKGRSGGKKKKEEENEDL